MTLAPPNKVIRIKDDDCIFVPPGEYAEVKDEIVVKKSSGCIETKNGFPINQVFPTRIHHMEDGKSKWEVPMSTGDWLRHAPSGTQIRRKEDGRVFIKVISNFGIG